MVDISSDDYQGVRVPPLNQLLADMTLSPDALVASADAVAAVCKANGLTGTGTVWKDDRVMVRLVNGDYGWQVSARDWTGGALVCEAGDFVPLPASVLSAAIEAAREAR